MSEPNRMRVSLVLPTATSRDIMAAIQVVLYMLRDARVELDLLRPMAGTSPAVVDEEAVGVLFVSTDMPVGTAAGWTREGYERRLRAWIERAYRRQSIAAVDYDLEII